MLEKTKLPPSATLAQRIIYPPFRNFFYFFFVYLAYAPIRRVNKPSMEGRYIWACSHSNFLCDGIPAGCEGPVPTKFLAKSSIFQFPLKPILDFLGALPLARPQDSRETSREERAAQNRSTFQAAIAALKNGWPVAIYPEGVSLVNPGLLLPLKPGVAKLALAAEEASDFSMGLRVIPVGLEYGSRTRVGSGLTFHYGKPIEVAEFRELHEADPAAAVEKLMQQLTHEMVHSFPHFTDASKQALGKKLVALGLSRNKFNVAQLFLRKEKDAEFWLGLEQKLRAFEEATKDHGIPLPAWGHRRAWKELGPVRRRWRFVYLAVASPAFFLDLPNNSLPEFFLGSVVEFLASDETELMTMRFMASPLVLGIAYALQFLFLRKLFFPNLGGWGGFGAYLAYASASFMLWYIAVHWRQQFKRLSSLVFFRMAGVDGRSEAVAKYRELRLYLGQF